MRYFDLLSDRYSNSFSMILIPTRHPLPLKREGVGMGIDSVYRETCFEIIVDQQTRTSDQTFEGVPDPNRPPVPAVQPRPNLVYFWPIYAKSPLHAQNPEFRCCTCSYWSPELVYVFSSRLDKWPSYKPKTICLYLDIHTKFDRFWPIIWSNVNIFKWNKLYMKIMPKLHILCKLLLYIC